MTLRWRLTLILAATAAVAIGSASGAAYLLARGELYGAVDAQLIDRSAMAGEGIRLFVPAELPSFFSVPLPTGPADVVRFDVVFQLLDPEGSIVFALGGNQQLPVEDVDRQVASSGGPPSLRSSMVGGVPFRMITAAVDGGGAVQMARDVSEIHAALAGLGGRLLLATLAGAALAAVAGWLIARHTVRPIEVVAAAAVQVATTQRLTAAIPDDSTGEVGRLAASFNTMLRALDSSRRQQQQLVLDAGHELRTPLTALRTNLEFLQRGEDLPPSEQREVAGAALAEAEELSRLADELVALATDVQRSDEPVAEIDLEDLAEKVAARARRRYGREIVVVGNGSTVRGRASQVERALGNLIDNAHKWSPDGTVVEVQLTGKRVEVRDHGPGIASEDLSHVFDRFYRATAARSMPGSGLGLAIVRHVVEGSGGRVYAANAAEGGAVVGFELEG